MVTKLNSFILKGETINLMKDLLERTSKTGLEHGFDMCSNQKTQKITGRNTCIGTNYEVSTKEECRRKEIYEGVYHTHPIPFGSEPSMNDLVLGLVRGINCIGAVKDNTIKCYVKKKIPEKEESIVIEEANKLIKKGYRLTVDESFMKMGFQDYIIKKYFETIDIK